MANGEGGRGNADLEKENGAKMTALMTPRDDGWTGRERCQWPRQVTQQMAQEDDEKDEEGLPS